MITSLVITARRSKYKLHSSKNTLFLKPFRLEGGGRYTMHNLTFTSLEMTVQSICSKCVNMPFRVESKVSKLRGTADYWNPQTRSHNTSFIQFTLVASSSANRIQTSFTCVSRCASSMPSVSVVASDSIHTHPNTEIRRSTSIDYTAVPSRAVRSSGLFFRADAVERPASRN